MLCLRFVSYSNVSAWSSVGAIWQSPALPTDLTRGQKKNKKKNATAFFKFKFSSLSPPRKIQIKNTYIVQDP